MKTFFPKIFMLVVALHTASALADGVALLKKISGNYPFTSLNGSTQVSGVVDIEANETGNIGYRLTNVFMAEGLQNFFPEVLTPASMTKVTEEAGSLVQEYQTKEESLRVEYHQTRDGISIYATRCKVNVSCEIAVINDEPLSSEVVAPANFFSSIVGRYDIVLVGGHPPHGDKIADVSDGGSEANLTFPYCPEAGGLCDPGYLDLIYASTKIVKRVLGPNHNEFLITSGKDHYSWEEKAGTFYFKNFQYQGGSLVLIHVLQKQ